MGDLHRLGCHGGIETKVERNAFTIHALGRSEKVQIREAKIGTMAAASSRSARRFSSARVLIAERRDAAVDDDDDDDLTALP